MYLKNLTNIFVYYYIGILYQIIFVIQLSFTDIFENLTGRNNLKETSSKGFLLFK